MRITALHDKAGLGHTNVALPQKNPSLPGYTHQGTSHLEVKPGIGREGDRLGLDGRIDIDLIEVLWLQEVPLFGRVNSLLEQQPPTCRLQDASAIGRGLWYDSAVCAAWSQSH